MLLVTIISSDLLDWLLFGEFRLTAIFGARGIRFNGVFLFFVFFCVFFFGGGGVKLVGGRRSWSYINFFDD